MLQTFLYDASKCYSKLPPHNFHCRFAKGWLNSFLCLFSTLIRIQFCFLWDIMLESDFVFHVRLGNNSAINSCCVLARRLAALQVWAQPLIVCCLSRLHRSSGRVVKKLSIMAIETLYGTLLLDGKTNWGKVHWAVTTVPLVFDNWWGSTITESKKINASEE